MMNKSFLWLGLVGLCLMPVTLFSCKGNDDEPDEGVYDPDNDDGNDQAANELVGKWTLTRHVQGYELLDADYADYYDTTPIIMDGDGEWWEFTATKVREYNNLNELMAETSYTYNAQTKKVILLNVTEFSVNVSSNKLELYQLVDMGPVLRYYYRYEFTRRK